MNSDFEKQLEGQALREIPAAWRAEIVAAANSRNSGSARGETRFAAWLHFWLWPHPRAWAALVAAWGVVLLVQCTLPGGATLRRDPYVQTAQSIAIRRQETLMMAQLLGSMDGETGSPALPPPPKPRSERREGQLIG